MDSRDCLNGLEKSLFEIDQEIIRATPHPNRKLYRKEAWEEVDQLLDQRNLITRMMSELALDQYVEMMEHEG